jgi:crotonobetaine/carnitine-CoA ligase
MDDKVFYEEYPINQRSVGFILSDKARKLKDQVFLYFKDRTVTFEELNNNANRVGNAFLKMGVKKGDKVCSMMISKPESLYQWFALSKIGAVEVPINTAYKGDLLQYIINTCDAEIMILDEQLLDRIKMIEGDLKNIKKLIVFSEKPEGEISNPTSFEMIPFSELLKGTRTDPTVELDWGELTCLLFTSGTTGLSKGAMIPVNYMYRLGTRHAQVTRYNPRDVTYCYLPLFHIGGKMVVLAALFTEAKMVLLERFSVRKFWEDARRYGVTIFFQLGGIMNMLYSQPAREDDADNPIEKGYCVPIAYEIADDFMKRFNIKKLQECYGATEDGLVISTPWDEQRRERSCGRPGDLYEAIIGDENDMELPTGEVGEILVRTKEPYAMMLGYYKMPEETLKALRNYWFHTGDQGYMDKDGWFYFKDRSKDVVRRQGENISSFEVEKVINKHPKVAESAVFGVPSELAEDEVMAVVVLKEGERMKPEEIIAFCEDRMAYFSVPRYIEFKESLPRTPTEKVEKYKLKGEGITDSTWDRVKAGYKLKR